MNTNSRLFFTLSLLTAANSPVAHATSFYERPFPDAVKDAPIVLRAKVGMSYGHWVLGNDGSKRLFTYIEMQVDEVLKGSVKGSTVIVRELGGEKDGVGMQVPGTAQFKRGEDVVVFANDERDKDGAYDLRGMMMGKYNVVRGEDGQETLTGAGLMGETHPGIRGHDHIVHPEHFSEGGGHDGTEGAPQWTLVKLRELIREQRDPHVSEDQARQNPLTESKPVKSQVIPSPSPAEVKAFSTAHIENGEKAKQALDLQSSSTSRPWSWMTVSLLAAAAAIFGLLVRWMLLKALRRG